YSNLVGQYVLARDYEGWFFFQAEDGIRVRNVTGVQTCALPISVADRGRPGDLRGGPGPGIRAAHEPGAEGRSGGAVRPGFGHPVHSPPARISAWRGDGGSDALRRDGVQLPGPDRHH